MNHPSTFSFPAMKTTVSLSVLATIALFAGTALAAPAPQDEAAKQKAAELAQLVRDNTNKANDLFREMADSGRKKNYANVTNCYEQIAALLALKEGAPGGISPYRLHMETANALCANFHLRWAGLAAKHYAEAEKAAPTPREKALAMFRSASFEYDVAASDDIKPLVAKIRSALALPELTKSEKLDLIFRYPTRIDPDFDVEAEAWKIAKDEPELHAFYYSHILPGMPREQNSTLDPRKSTERMLEICRKALADPAVSGRSRGQFVDREINALIDLERFVEAEKILVGYASTTNLRSRAEWNKRLGNFYVEQAKRYYLPSYEPTLRKALAAYIEAMLANPHISFVEDPLCSTAMQLKDYKAVEDAVARRIALNKGETNVWCWSQLGRVAYAKEDYAAAAAAFGAAEEKLDRASRRLYAESLNALGRTEETIAQLQILEKEDYRSVKDSTRYYIQYLKKRLEEEKAK